MNQSELALVRINPDWKLGFGLVRIHSYWCLGINRMNSDWFLIIFYQTRCKTFRINANHSDLGLIRIDSDWKSDWKLGFRLVRIHSYRCVGMNRIESDWFLIIFHQTRYKTCFGLIRIGSDTDIGKNRNSSNWLGMNFNPILSLQRLKQKSATQF